MKKAMESLRWVAYEEYSYAQSDSDEDVVKANDESDSSESSEIKTDREVSSQNLDSEGSEETESDDEGQLKALQSTSHY